MPADGPGAVHPIWLSITAESRCRNVNDGAVMPSTVVVPSSATIAPVASISWNVEAVTTPATMTANSS